MYTVSLSLSLSLSHTHTHHEKLGFTFRLDPPLLVIGGAEE